MAVQLPGNAPPPVTSGPDVQLPSFLDVFTKPRRILLIGMTGTGKTTQVGELAKYIFEQTGRQTLLNFMDRGDTSSIDHLIDEEIIILNSLFVSPTVMHDPFIFLEKTVRGQVFKNGKWGPAPKNIGLRVFDSGTGIGEEQLKRTRDSQATDAPIGPKAYTFSIATGGEAIKVGTTDKSHYGIIQGRIVDGMWDSTSWDEDPKYPCHLIWTAGLRRVDQDDDTKLPQLGPDLAGKALLGTAPRWFSNTFCQTKISSLGGGNRHILHLDAYADAQMGGVQVVGNGRVPLGGADVSKGGIKVPDMIEPASLVKALNYLAARQLAAREEVRGMKADVKARLGL
jgi:SRP54 family protein